MSKNQDAKKDGKKRPAKTLMEKRAAKRDKRNGKQDKGLIDQTRK